MKKIIITLCAVALIGSGFVGASTQAKANDVGVGIGLGILGGAVLGAAIAQPRQPVVVERRVYVDEPTMVCHHVRMEDEYGNHFVKRVCHPE